jgi:hypothetical protein
MRELMARMNAEIGTRYRLEGLLQTTARGFMLHMEDGGVWVLEADPEAHAYAGRRVIIEGVRSGFDRIDVDWIGLASANSPDQ